MMERIIRALEEGIKRELNLRTIILPQKAAGATAAISLSFAGIEAAGETADNHEVNAMEKVQFWATYSTGGTHAAWVNRAIVDSRKLNKLNSDGKIEIVVRIDQDKTKRLYATWSRQQAGSFVYSDDVDEGKKKTQVLEMPWTSFLAPAQCLLEPLPEQELLPLSLQAILSKPNLH